MDALIKKMHRQLSQVRGNIFNTIYAFDVDIYRPYKDAEGKYVLEDEILFEEADDMGKSKAEEDLPISYTVLDTSKAVRCKIDEETGKLSFIRDSESNEFEVDKQFKYLIQKTDIPSRTVMQFDVSKSLVDESDYDEWDSETTYAADAMVRIGGHFYKSLQSGNLDNDPETDDGTWWENESHQTITLIKVSTLPVGNQPYVDNVHVFVPFHGDMD